MSATVRQLRYRHRVRDGRAVLAIEVDVVEVAEMLVASGKLRAEETDDREAIARAIEAQVRTLVELHRLTSSREDDNREGSAAFRM